MSEQDKQIAEEIFGWHLEDFEIYQSTIKYWYDDEGHQKRSEPGFNPTTDANDDHIVLEHIKGNWIFSKRQQFLMALQNNLIEKMKEAGHLSASMWDSVLFYEPGDYSRAALKVIA